MKYIISGTGRSGTKLIHSVLRDLGVSIGRHEISLGDKGGVGGYRVIPKMSKNKNDYKIIVQMREPLLTVNSILKSTPSDFFDLGLIKKDFNDITKYTLHVWFKIYSTLLNDCVLSYTLDHLNDGKVSKELIKLFNINCSKEDFDKQVKESYNAGSRNARQGGPNLSLDQLQEKDPIMFNQAYSLYNSIKNGK
tara:strand:+ start:17809 stop:18387 length:579 start_codon:yes stop_codon:yes gene_type:complete